MKHLLKLLFIAIIVFAAACKEKDPPKPEGLLSEEKFSAVMVEVQFAEALDLQRKQIDKDSSETIFSYYKEIFKRHNISLDEFVNTYDYYIDKPDEMGKIYEQVLDSLNKLDAELKINFAPRFKDDTLGTDSLLIPDTIIRVRDSLKRKGIRIK